jgi:predicted nucleotidyltransferase component of viral defense system
MIPGALLLEWQKEHPWAMMTQVEQDLIISRVMTELFRSQLLAENLVFRGGTALHKLHLPAPYRYSEDLDFVQIRPGPIGPIFDAVRGVLEPWMGKAQRKQGGGVITMIHKVQSEAPDGRMLRIKIQINSREHFSVLGVVTKAFTVASSWFQGAATIPTFRLEEMLGSKLRALYQRQKSRDLFDLWVGLTHGRADAPTVVRCFRELLSFEGVRVSGTEFRRNLDAKLARADYLRDVEALMRPDVRFVPEEAAAVVRRELVDLLDEGLSGPQNLEKGK